MKADDYGRFTANPRLIRANLFPLLIDSIREADITRWITDLKKAGLIALYLVEAKPLLEIKNFGQRLKQSVPKYPPPQHLPGSSGKFLLESETESETNNPHHHKNRDGFPLSEPEPDESVAESAPGSNPRPRKGGSLAPTGGGALPDYHEIKSGHPSPISKRFQKPTPQEVEDYGNEIGYAPYGIGASFCDYYEARGWCWGPGKPMKNWKAAVRTWKNRNSEDRKHGKPGNGFRPNSQGDGPKLEPADVVIL